MGSLRSLFIINIYIETYEATVDLEFKFQLKYVIGTFIIRPPRTIYHQAVLGSPEQRLYHGDENQQKLSLLRYDGNEKGGGQFRPPDLQDTGLYRPLLHVQSIAIQQRDKENFNTLIDPVNMISESVHFQNELDHLSHNTTEQSNLRGRAQKKPF